MISPRLRWPLMALATAVLLAAPVKADQEDAADTQAPEEHPLSERAEKALAKFDRTGEFETCISLVRLKESRPLDDYRILWRTGVNEYYLMEMPHRCSGLGFERRFTYTTSLSQLCNTDIITVLDTNGFPRGACGLGKFELLKEKPEAGPAEASQNGAIPASEG